MPDNTTRRGFMRAASAPPALSGAVLGLTVASGIAAASHLDSKPDHVTLSYDQPWLETYQPSVSMQSSDRAKLIRQYAWRATSPEYDTDVGVYWMSYTHQAGVSEYDSHYGDHEPYYVFVDSDTGDVTEVVASVYHWLRGRAPASGVSFQDDTHPKTRVISPWHHHTATTESGFFPELGDLTQVFDSWLANGLEEDLAIGAATDPWIMAGPAGRTHWWQNDVGGFSVNATYVSVLRGIGIHEAGSL